MVKISVIVPVYNAENYIEKCVNSILNQSFKDFEVLLIIDGSTDDSLKILKKFAKLDDRVVVINQKNMGVAFSRNKGIEKSQGEYIVFVDNDDYIDKDYLEQFYSETMSKPDLVIGGYRRVSDNKVLYDFKIKNTDWGKYTFITPWGRIIKRDFLIKNKIKFLSYPIGEDIYFNLQIYSISAKIKLIPYIGYNWYYNDSSVSNTVHRGFNSSIDITFFLDKIFPFTQLNRYNNYFCYKFEVWYLLYSGRFSNNKVFIKEYKKILSWNREKGISMSIFPLSQNLNGESVKNRLFVLLFFLLDKLHLVGLFARFYCKEIN